MPDYCIYQAMENSQGLNPAIAMGDTVCVVCPDGGECRGRVGANVAIRLRDQNGNEDNVVLRLQHSDCRDCPDGGKTGYGFADDGGLY